ncbi:MAG TPA: DUF167 domain-containing protein [Gemmatimonadaceae bacterium]|nr:DUF167 domain-containing protein [Gemmatimonadaceae bacterium]
MTSLTLRVKVKPRSNTTSLTQSPDGTWVARLRSPPVDGKANDELIALVAEQFRCRKADVRIAAGATARMKRLTIDLS